MSFYELPLCWIGDSEAALEKKIAYGIDSTSWVVLSPFALATPQGPPGALSRHATRGGGTPPLLYFNNVQ